MGAVVEGWLKAKASPFFLLLCCVIMDYDRWSILWIDWCVTEQVPYSTGILAEDDKKWQNEWELFLTRYKPMHEVHLSLNLIQSDVM